jgi:hypothetical protein
MKLLDFDTYFPNEESRIAKFKAMRDAQRGCLL